VGFLFLQLVQESAWRRQLLFRIVGGERRLGSLAVDGPVPWVSFRTDPLVSGARQSASPAIVQARDRAAGTGIAPILVGLYTRIIIMQLAIIGGALISQFTGSLAPLVIVMVLKTVVDLALAAFVPLKALFVSGETTASGH
jgi:hypothetical protein